MRAALLVLAPFALAPFAPAAAATLELALFSRAPTGAPPAPWKVATSPKIARHTQYDVVALDGTHVLRARADASYANLVHELPPGSVATRLAWRWRVDRLIEGADLARKSGDDVPARVCALFDLPLDRLSAGDRFRIRLGRMLFDPKLPAAAICYVWDTKLAPGTWLANAYTDRVRMLVLRQGLTGRWFDESRDLRADFAAAFAQESKDGLPPLAAVALSADADNTAGQALSYFGDIVLETE
ncbi:MAG: DUF3047 domain-containing protein [Burkholderiaceae bacterium]